MLLHTKQASEPSPKLIIVATGTHGNNGGPGIAMLHPVADPGPLDGPMEGRRPEKWCDLDVVCTAPMMLLPTKQASETSSVPIIVATGTHGNNAGPGIANLYKVADPWPSVHLTGC